MIDRTHREFSDEDIGKITDIYHAWREGRDEYEDAPGFCKSATLDVIRSHNHVLTPGRYVGTKVQEEDGEPFEEKMARLSSEWREQQKEAKRLNEAIASSLKELGYGG